MKQLESLTLGQILEKSATGSPDKAAIVDGDRRTTYAELNAAADALAAGLAGLGFEKGDRVAIFMKNSLEFVTAFYALQKIGVVVVWVNAIYRMHEAEFILKNSAKAGSPNWQLKTTIAKRFENNNNAPNSHKSAQTLAGNQVHNVCQMLTL